MGFLTQEELEKYCIELGRAMYGNVDAPPRWMKTFSDYLKHIGLIQSKVDPCMFYKHDEKGELCLIMVMYVDDTLVAGRREEVKWCYEKIRERFNIDELGNLNKHPGIWYEWMKDEKGESYLKATMPEMVKEIIQDYEKLDGVPALKKFHTPGTPGKVLNKNEGEKVKQTEYRSLVGKLLYYMTKTCPEMANVCRELSSHFDNPGEQHWKELSRAVSFLKTEGDKGLIYRSPESLQSVSFSDSNYATDPEGRKSISGRVNTLGGMITSWSSKKQGSVTLSSTEAELVAATDCAKEGIFTNNLIQELTGNVQPIKIYEDNVGVIFLTKNHQVGGRTKHIAVREFYLRDLFEEKQAEIEFVK